MKSLLTWWRHPAMRRTVIVNIVGENVAIRGVLWDGCGAWTVLKNCAALSDAHEAKPIDGDVVIERARISFLQAY